MSHAQHKPIVFIISAPSGSGKSTLVAELLTTASALDFSISYTTRDPRGREKNGKQYYFVSNSEFERMIQDNEFLEHANVFGNYYGTARRFLREAEQNGHDLLLDIDVQGARLIKRELPAATSIFILPPNRQTLEDRLRKRSEDAEEVIQRRLGTATREIEDYDKYNYVLVNDELQDSVQRLQAIVRSERMRRPAHAVPDNSNSNGEKSVEANSAEDKKVVELAEQCRLANIRDRVQPILASFASQATAGY